jgi:hypothetical protein
MKIGLYKYNLKVNEQSVWPRHLTRKEVVPLNDTKVFGSHHLESNPQANKLLW